MAKARVQSRAKDLMRRAVAGIAEAQPRTASALKSLFKKLILPVLEVFVAEAVRTSANKERNGKYLKPVRNILNDAYPPEDDPPPTEEERQSLAEPDAED